MTLYSGVTGKCILGGGCKAGKSMHVLETSSSLIELNKISVYGPFKSVILAIYVITF